VPQHIAAQHSSSPFFCQSDSLLFQFILWEFFTTCLEITATKEEFSVFTTPETIRFDSTFITKIDSHRSKLTQLSIKESPQLNILHLKSGSLDKLQCYFQAFQGIKKSDKKYTSLINKHISRCFLNILELEEILPSKNALTSKQKISQKTLRIAKMILEKIEISTSKIRNLLFFLIQSYGKDENILSFLLRHQQLFEKCFGKGTLLKHIKNIFPEGILQFQNYLQSAFSKRGFKHVIPSINHFIDILQKENAEI
jgi:hypothetical protein